MTTERSNLSFNTKFCNVKATITLDKTIILQFLWVSFHLQAVSTTIFLTSRLLFLSSTLAGKLCEGETDTGILICPSATSLSLPWAKHVPRITPLERLKKTLVVLGSSQLSKCVAGSDFIHPFKKYTHTRTHLNHKLSLRHLRTQTASSSSHPCCAWHSVK